jgi:DNA polymerase III gamma/tau subunit
MGAAPSNTVGPCTYTHIRSTLQEKLSVVMTHARSTAPTSPTPQRPRRTPQRQPKRQPKRQPSKPTRVPNPTRREPSTPDPDRREPSTPSPSSDA